MSIECQNMSLICPFFRYETNKVKKKQKKLKRSSFHLVHGFMSFIHEITQYNL